MSKLSRHESNKKQIKGNKINKDSSPPSVPFPHTWDQALTIAHFLKRSVHAYSCIHAKVSKRPRPVGHCVLDRQSLKGFAALCCRSVSWSKSETGKIPRMALEPVCNTSNLTLTSASNWGTHWLNICHFSNSKTAASCACTSYKRHTTGITFSCWCDKRNS